MPAAWRLIKTKYLAAAWDGEGAKRNGGRWNNAGTPIVYVSSTLALALVETLVHLPSGVLPAYTAIRIEFHESMIETLESKNLPADWMNDPAPATTKTLGDEWAAAAKKAILRVPSVVVPMEFNYLLNPNHPDFSRITIGAPLKFPFDTRLARRQGA